MYPILTLVTSNPRIPAMKSAEITQLWSTHSHRPHLHRHRIPLLRRR